MIKKIFFFGAILLSLVIINNLARSTYDLWHKQDLVIKAQKDLEKQKEENQKLKARLSYVGTREFVENEARNDLFMVKPGESGVIVPSDLLQDKTAKKVAPLPNWQKWLNLFISGQN